jgi:2-keto-4-pentenoate hydratase/2-oxohepta-3-ene-1,7-dioic acid hydratase in catechol pathway
MSFALATVRLNSGPTPVLEAHVRHYVLSEVAPELLASSPERGLMNLFPRWDRVEKELVRLVERLETGETGVIAAPGIYDYMTPLQYPAKVVLGGANYYEHMHKEVGVPDFRKEDGMPVFFLKPPTTSLVGCGKTVRYPAQSSKFDWEIELAVVIGRTLRRASDEEAANAVAGYAVGIDLSARDWQLNPKHPFKFDLFAGKAFDDSCPLGPKIVPSRFVDSGNLQLKLLVNGELKQNANTSDMIWSPEEQIAAVSQHLTLEPGDILLTGTPAGVGLATGEYLKVGDIIEAEIDGLGTLKIQIKPDTASQ